MARLLLEAALFLCGRTIRSRYAHLHLIHVSFMSILALSTQTGNTLLAGRHS